MSTIPQYPTLHYLTPLHPLHPLTSHIPYILLHPLSSSPPLYTAMRLHPIVPTPLHRSAPTPPLLPLYTAMRLHPHCTLLTPPLLPPMQSFVNKLYRISGKIHLRVNSCRVDCESLHHGFAYIFDCNKTIFVWYGKNTTLSLQSKARLVI